MSLAALLVGVAVLLWPRRTLPLGRSASPRDRTERTPRPDAATAAELFAAGLEAGLTPAEATRWCAPGAPEPGPDLAAWWDDLAPGVARALRVCERLGSPAAATVRAAADAERARAGVDRSLHSGLAGVRATAWLLTALPVVGALAVLALQPPHGSLAGLGYGAMALGACSTALGALVLRGLVRRARTQADA